MSRGKEHTVWDAEYQKDLEWQTYLEPLLEKKKKLIETFLKEVPL